MRDVKFPREAGSIPLKLLKPRRKVSRFANDPSSEGTLPPRWFLNKIRANNLEQLNRSTGSSPPRLLMLIFKYLSLNKFPTWSGIVPPIELSERLSDTRKERLPIDGDIIPLNCLPPSSKRVTLLLLRPHVTPSQLQRGDELFHEDKTSCLSSET
ncbi:hypothetical protein F2Q69_00002812 [Brassica cretica]|uniref:Uncharacterized protein n=1 Tax=Brassica cretica TaxID=69181 RepID=A0A8S9PEY3_BRACR|nr:hypothetical protein F2Q69_00002812 [Brassica cretica]